MVRQLVFGLTIAVLWLTGSGLRADEWTDLSMSGAAQADWQFVGGDWNENDERHIQPPGELVDENVTFFTRQAYGDFEAEFDFRWDSTWTTAGFMFRAQDARHYYVIDFPAVGQQYRANHFWCTISKVDARGWREGLHMQMVHGVSSKPSLWHKARVVVNGAEIRVWCDGRPMTTVRDETYSTPGFVGLVSYNSNQAGKKSTFRNLRIRGSAIKPPEWSRSIQPVRNWSVLDPEKGTGCSNIVRASNGDLLVIAGGRLWRSVDNARTWAVDETDLPAFLQSSIMHKAKDGRLEAYSIDIEPPFLLRRSRSNDHGLTWSESGELMELKFPDGFRLTNTYVTRLLETSDGSLLLFAYANSKDQLVEVRGRLDWTFEPSPKGMNYCLRSTDGGQSWSQPIDIDGPPYEGPWLFRTTPSEISATQTKQGDLLALVRPNESPLMAESWSHDDGQTWTPLAHGPFPMYACNNSMLTTTSGVIIIGGRFPGIALQISRDEGMTWQFHQIDQASWANGAMLEVEPDVVLFVYGGPSIPPQLRYQLIRVTSNNVEPIRVVDVVKADTKPERDQPNKPSRKLLLIGGPFDHHPVGSHEYMAGLRIISKCLEGVEGLDIRIANSEDAWNEGPDMIDSSDGVLLFREQGARWLKQDPKRLAAFERLAKRGGGCAALHFGMGTVDAENIEPFVSIFGACHGGPDRKDNVFDTMLTIADRQHPVCRGIGPFAVRDEFYYQLKRVKRPASITPLLQATLEGNAETIAWAWDRADGGRSFGFTGLHFHENWKLPEYRRLVAQGILWSLKLPIPENGVKVDVPDEVLQLEKKTP
ncbi:MAG: DUF1080 domain-containing protein [Planctomycetes bacterium]|nr:DUF1080 domain-containing protein [Planctomycetota bacterium]